MNPIKITPFASGYLVSMELAGIPWGLVYGYGGDQHKAVIDLMARLEKLQIVQLSKS